ncbi:hypothetical protein AYO45_05710 [Gammaproteobacteria bacterium SCGC AG-212-F23]|nr:hypothetical protein AYO45_05710 [Gammaproteobacteria bacterium SCGC AG-212-F23]
MPYNPGFKYNTPPSSAVTSKTMSPPTVQGSKEVDSSGVFNKLCADIDSAANDYLKVLQKTVKKEIYNDPSQCLLDKKADATDILNAKKCVIANDIKSVVGTVKNAQGSSDLDRITQIRMLLQDPFSANDSTPRKNIITKEGFLGPKPGKEMLRSIEAAITTAANILDSAPKVVPKGASGPA